MSEVANRGTDFLFDEALNKYGEEEGLSQDEEKYIRRVIELVVEFETLYRFHIINRGSPKIDDFKEEISPLGREAAELAAVGELRRYSEREVEALARAALAAEFFEQHIPEVDDILPSKDDSETITEKTGMECVKEFYSETEAPRELIASVAKDNHTS